MGQVPGRVGKFEIPNPKSQTKSETGRWKRGNGKMGQAWDRICHLQSEIYNLKSAT
jgi:hypothetical protein